MSSLKRGVVDHLMLTTTSRWVANLSLVKNPRDLLDNRVGAVVDVMSPNPESVVRPLPTPQLNGNVYSAIENFEQEISKFNHIVPNEVVDKLKYPVIEQHKIA